VEVPLQPPSFLVLRADQALAGGPELFDQPDVPKDQPRLGGKILQQLGLGRLHGLPRRLLDPDHAQELTLVSHGYRRVRPLDGDVVSVKARDH
jgi:hypothetical protein